MTVVIILGIMAVALYSSPPVAYFFHNMRDRIFGVVPVQTQMNVSFSLTSGEYKDIVFRQQNIEIIIDPLSFSAELDTGNIKTDSRVQIRFIGSGSIRGRELILDGSFENLVAEGLNLKSGKIKANSTFDTMHIINMSLVKLNLEGTAGTVTTSSGDTTVNSQSVEINEMSGDFYFNELLEVDGKSNKLSIDGKIVIET